MAVQIFICFFGVYANVKEMGTQNLSEIWKMGDHASSFNTELPSHFISTRDAEKIKENFGF